MIDLCLYSVEAHGRKCNTVFYPLNSRQLPPGILEPCHGRVITKTICLHGKAAKALERRRITSKTDGTSARAIFPSGREIEAARMRR